MAEDPRFLTELEHKTIAHAGELAGMLAKIVGDNPRTRGADLSELITNIHAIQNAVLAQAAARAYPDEYRLMGEFHG